MLGGPTHAASLAMKLWLAQRFGGAGRTLSSAPAHAAGKAMESLEHLVRSRIRMFLRNTWLVAILGTAIVAGIVWLAFYFISENAVMKVAAGPAGGVDAQLVEFLAKKFAHDRATIKLELVATSGPAQSTQAIADRSADLAILPANVGASADWPVVAILRQNVMAHVPAPATATPAPATPGEAKPSAKTEEVKETTGKKGAKEAKEAKDRQTGQAQCKGGEKRKGRRGKKRQGRGAEKRQGRRCRGVRQAREDSSARRPPRRHRDRQRGDAGLLNVVLTHYGVPLDKVQVSQIEPKNIASAIADNQVDVLFVAGPAAGHGHRRSGRGRHAQRRGAGLH